MLSCKINLSDIFVAGLMSFIEDKVRFAFIGIEDININKLEDVIIEASKEIERSTKYGSARTLPGDSGEKEGR